MREQTKPSEELAHWLDPAFTIRPMLVALPEPFRHIAPLLTPVYLFLPRSSFNEWLLEPVCREIRSETIILPINSELGLARVGHCEEDEEEAPLAAQ